MDTIIIDGDQVQFLPVFKGAIVAVKPGIITGSGETTINGKNICVAGDEASVQVSDCAYIAGTFLGGFGTLTIKKFENDQFTNNSNCGTDPIPIIRKGGMFPVEFTVDIKGTDPSNGKMDQTPTYEGQGNFVSANMKIKAD